MAVAETILQSSLLETSELLQRGEVSPVELITATLDRISALDGRLHSFISVLAKSALEQAVEAEKEIDLGNYRGPLHGIPIGLKDIIDVAGSPTTCASSIRKDFVAKTSATVVKKLQDAGAIIIGKNNLSEFAFVGTDSAFRRPNNSWNLDYWAGGSSSGSAVAVSAGLCFGAVGTDTGGSIRYPAAFCGVVGIKPSYGRVSRTGVMPLSDTLDHVGPIARNVTDAAIILEAISGPDDADPTCRRYAPIDFQRDAPPEIRGVIIGYDAAYCSDDTEPEIADAATAAVDLLSRQDAIIQDVSLSRLLPCLDYQIDTISTNALCCHSDLIGAPFSDYSPVFQGLLEHARTVSAERYARAEHERNRLISFLDDVFAQVDCIVCPATTIAPKPNTFWDNGIVEDSDSGVRNFGRFACPFNYAGVPTITVPCGFDSHGMPVAIQIVSQRGDERTMLKVAAAFEAAVKKSHSFIPKL